MPSIALSELLGATVFDRSGFSAGKVREVAIAKGFDFGRPMERIHRTIDRCDAAA